LSLKRQFARTAFAALVSTALLLFVATPLLHADGRERCQHDIEKAEAKLDKAIRDHGDHSRAADDRRRDLNAEREHCWEKYHQWWNGRDHRWEMEHNWDGPR